MLPGKSNGNLGTVLEGLHGATPDLEASAVVTEDGFILGSMLPGGMDDEQLAETTLQLAAAAQQALQALGRGELDQIYLKSDCGIVIVTTAGDGMLLAVLARKEAMLGRIILNLKQAAHDVRAFADAPTGAVRR